MCQEAYRFGPKKHEPQQIRHKSVGRPVENSPQQVVELCSKCFLKGRTRRAPGLSSDSSSLNKSASSSVLSVSLELSDMLQIQTKGILSNNGLKQSVNAEYYINEILEKCCLPTYKRKKMRGPLAKRKLYRKMSDTLFVQDGAPAHTAKKTQKWHSNHLSGFWAKDIWPSNSPDLSPIENLWAIMQAELDKGKLATNLKQLTKILENI
ncbi:hypothetical protein LOD99_11973 [Oopsacas minuta]|uniref:Tc1-like transposase DDE domain-containing protein n=1 Tax=Oopsacas minuta TaxID=111878 RepID=A0AAV7JH77_9METZ|nr:hypothetical protein LOD99_11973 [Oopsacas minuta]